MQRGSNWLLDPVWVISRVLAEEWYNCLAYGQTPMIRVGSVDCQTAENIYGDKPRSTYTISVEIQS